MSTISGASYAPPAYQPSVPSTKKADDAASETRDADDKAATAKAAQDGAARSSQATGSRLNITV